MNTEREIDIRSEEVKDIIGYVPNWMIRWGNILILSLVVSFVLSLFLIKYPNVIHSEITITASVPPANERLGKILLPLRNSGKVKEGQKVQICLEEYPCEEWGMLQGKVKTISLVPQNGKYLIEVELPKVMKTSYNRSLAFKHEMVGQAKIITEELKLIERVFYGFKKITSDKI